MNTKLEKQFDEVCANASCEGYTHFIRDFIDKHFISKKEAENNVIENIGEMVTLCGKLQEFPDKTLVGGCSKEVSILKVYACVDCSAPFHRRCLLKHMQYEMKDESLSKMPLKKALKKVDSLKPIK